MDREKIDWTLYQSYEKTIGMLKANIYALLVMGPFTLAGLIIYLLIWPNGSYTTNIGSFLAEAGVLLVGYLLLILAHEWVHGVTWHFCCEHGWKSIKFGIMKPSMTPYCHCSEPLTLRQYRLGCLMPLIITGLLPYLIALMFGNGLLLMLSLIMIIGAGGDAIIFICLMKEKPGALVIDHETLCGYVAYRPIKSLKG